MTTTSDTEDRNSPPRIWIPAWETVREDVGDDVRRTDARRDDVRRGDVRREDVRDEIRRPEMGAAPSPDRLNRTPSRPARAVRQPPTNRQLVRRALSTPQAARQALLLREVLGPPVGLGAVG